MESIVELYKIGRGPSSSHMIGPERACRFVKRKYPEANRFKAVLYGSLAKTGKGHGTDEVIRKTFYPYACEIEFNLTETNLCGSRFSKNKVWIELKRSNYELK